MKRLKAKMLSWVEEKHEPTHKFLTRDDKPYPTIRSLGSIALILLLGATLLWGATGQPLGAAPVVVIESGSMMHCEQGFVPRTADCDTKTFLGIGTIDTGDLIFVKAPGTIETMAQDGKERHGFSGDTVVYQPGGRTDTTPIIHRAIFYLQINEDGTYTIPELGLESIDSLNHAAINDEERFNLNNGCKLSISKVGHGGLGPEDSGFITKGDNNPCFDQTSGGLIGTPVQEDWIVGKARGEVPWIGVVKLFVFDFLQGTDNHGTFAPGNIKAAGWIVVGTIVLGPTVYEFVQKKRGKEEEEASGEDSLEP